MRRVEVVATVSKVEGRKILFELVARDEVEEIGRGTHERIVVAVERFEKRVKEKIPGPV